MAKIDALTLALRTAALEAKKAKALAFARRKAGEPFTDEQRRAYRAMLLAAVDVELEEFAMVPVPEGASVDEEPKADKGGEGGQPD